MKRMNGRLMHPIFALAMLLAGSFPAQSQTNITFPGNFNYLITTNTYAPDSDWSLAVKQEFGLCAEVVDWNTLKTDFGGSLDAIRGLFDYLGIMAYPVGDAPAVTWNGSQTWNGSRSYGVNRLEGVVPGGYLVHDEIQNYWVTLGSWPANRRIIARVPLAADWTLVTNSAPWNARGHFGSVQYDGKVWILGGSLGPGHLENDVWYSSDMTNWTEVTPSAPWSERYVHMSCVYNGKMWVMGGGYVGTYAAYNDVWSSTNGVNWTQENSAAAWSPRQGAGLVEFNGKLWLLGGVASEGGWVYKNDVWNSTDGVNWTQVTNVAPWGVRASGASFVFNGKMWILGGWNGSASRNDVWSTADGTNWTQVTTAAPWAARGFIPSVVCNGKMWILGGLVNNNTVYTNDVWYSADGLSWSQGPIAPWPGRSGEGVVVINNKIWLFGGDVGSYSYLNDVWFYSGSCVATVRPPSIVTLPTTSNRLAVINGLNIVLKGEPVTFTVGVTDPNSLPWSCLWDFGDGATSSDCSPTHTFTNCGPQIVTVTLDNGLSVPASTNLHITVPCQLNIGKGKLKATVNFAKFSNDTCNVTATLDLGGLNPTNQTLVVDIGGAQRSFQLNSRLQGTAYIRDSKGRQVSVGTCRLTYTKPKTRPVRPGFWTVTATLNKGTWRDQWHEHGLVNDLILAKAGYTVTVPVTVVIGPEAFAGEKLLHYTAKQNKTGTAK